MNFAHMVALARAMAQQQPYTPVGDVINKSGTFAAMQDQTEQMRRLNPWSMIQPMNAPIIPLVPLEKRTPKSK